MKYFMETPRNSIVITLLLDAIKKKINLRLMNQKSYNEDKIPKPKGNILALH